MEEGEPVDENKEEKNVFAPLKYNVLICLGLSVIQFINPSIGLAYAFFMVVQLAINGLLFLIYLFIPSSNKVGIYLLSFITVLFMAIATISISCGGRGSWYGK